eukprot:TRINITY_DN1427_c0_g3_i1.p1 TRINITY_DN1427_c0_g3~~TRINITY_DN1427_c0_g3_i1.p1  ORF type:complete len:1112 (+),score=191.68 TRINITY_DN1427_c0_g3_i1:2392-5727(+)
MARDLVHPNILALHGATRLPKTPAPALIMDRCEVNLRACLDQQDRRLTLPVKINILVQAAQAVTYIHNAGVMHRDIKASNILLNFVGDRPCVYLSDFGLSRAETRMDMYRSMSVQGTPSYMAPETALARCYTSQSDVYSFALLMWEVATGKKVNEGKGIEEVLQALRNDVRPSPLPTEPEGLAAVIQQAWKKDMMARPAMRDILLVLEDMDHKLSPLASSDVAMGVPLDDFINPFEAFGSTDESEVFALSEPKQPLMASTPPFSKAPPKPSVMPPPPPAVAKMRISSMAGPASPMSAKATPPVTPITPVTPVTPVASATSLSVPELLTQLTTRPRSVTSELLNQLALVLKSDKHVCSVYSDAVLNEVPLFAKLLAEFETLLPQVAACVNILDCAVAVNFVEFVEYNGKDLKCLEALQQPLFAAIKRFDSDAEFAAPALRLLARSALCVNTLSPLPDLSQTIASVLRLHPLHDTISRYSLTMIDWIPENYSLADTALERVVEMPHAAACAFELWANVEELPKDKVSLLEQAFTAVLSLPQPNVEPLMDAARCAARWNLQGAHGGVSRVVELVNDIRTPLNETHRALAAVAASTAALPFMMNDVSFFKRIDAIGIIFKYIESPVTTRRYYALQAATVTAIVPELATQLATPRLVQVFQKWRFAEDLEQVAYVIGNLARFNSESLCCTLLQSGVLTIIIDWLFGVNTSRPAKVKLFKTIRYLILSSGDGVAEILRSGASKLITRCDILVEKEAIKALEFFVVFGSLSRDQCFTVLSELRLKCTKAKLGLLCSYAAACIEHAGVPVSQVMETPMLRASLEELREKARWKVCKGSLTLAAKCIPESKQAQKLAVHLLRLAPSCEPFVESCEAVCQCLRALAEAADEADVPVDMCDNLLQRVARCMDFSAELCNVLLPIFGLCLWSCSVLGRRRIIFFPHLQSMLRMQPIDTDAARGALGTLYEIALVGGDCRYDPVVGAKTIGVAISEVRAFLARIDTSTPSYLILALLGATFMVLTTDEWEHYGPMLLNVATLNSSGDHEAYDEATRRSWSEAALALQALFRNPGGILSPNSAEVNRNRLRRNMWSFCAKKRKYSASMTLEASVPAKSHGFSGRA